jgi:hypothetical protein
MAGADANMSSLIELDQERALVKPPYGLSICMNCEKECCRYIYLYREPKSFLFYQTTYTLSPKCNTTLAIQMVFPSTTEDKNIFQL